MYQQMQSEDKIFPANILSQITFSFLLYYHQASPLKIRKNLPVTILSLVRGLLSFAILKQSRARNVCPQILQKNNMNEALLTLKLEYSDSPMNF